MSGRCRRRRPAWGTRRATGRRTSTTPGASAQDLAGRGPSVTSLSKTAWTATECVVTTGTRTQVAETLSSGRPRILRDSLRTLSSSELQPSSFGDPAHGTTFSASGAGNGPSSSPTTRRMSPAWVPSSRLPATFCDLVVKGVDSGLAGAGRGLVRGDDQLGQAELRVQRAHRDDHGQCRAVGIRDDPLGPVAYRPGVDLGHDEGDVRVHPECAGVVDGYRAPLGGNRRPLRRDVVGNVEHRDVDAVEDLRRERQNFDVLATHRQPASCRPRRRHQSDLAPYILAGREQVAHDCADGTGRADDGQRGLAGAGHRPVPP